MLESRGLDTLHPMNKSEVLFTPCKAVGDGDAVRGAHFFALWRRIAKFDV